METISQYPAWVTCHLQIDPGTLDIWLFSLSDGGNKVLMLTDFLSPDERLRSFRFATRELSDTFVICRGTLRNVLSHYLCTNPESIVFGYNSWGKHGIIAPADIGIGFNLSHSGEMAVVAITRGDSPGVNIEQTSRAVNYEEIANQEFSRPEQALLVSAAPGFKKKLFFMLWTRKEAVLKGIGKGLSIELSRVDASDIVSGLVSIEGHYTDGDRWRVMDIPIIPGYAGACAFHREIRILRYFDADE